MDEKYLLGGESHVEEVLKVNVDAFAASIVLDAEAMG